MELAAAHLLIGLLAGAGAVLGSLSVTSDRPRAVLPCALLGAASGALLGLTLVYAVSGPRLYGSLSLWAW